MAQRFLLIHGFAAGLTAPPIRNSFGPNRGFTIFDPLLHTGEAVVFTWGIDQVVSPVSLLNPSMWQQLYLTEKKIAQTKETHTALLQQIQEVQPTTIVCHSMGSFLLTTFLETYPLPPCVQTILFLQSDLPRSTQPSTSLPLFNFYCPWDPTLLISSLRHHERRWGQAAILENATIRNIFFPLRTPFYLHQNCLKDPRLLAKILQVLSARSRS